MTVAGAHQAEQEPARPGPRSPLRALGRFWPVAVVFGIVGALLGLGVASLQATTTTAESRVAVGYGDLTAGAIAGFPVAAGELAANYARYVTEQGLTGEQAPGVSLSASPIPESNVIRIQATGADAGDALAAVRTSAEDLVAIVNQNSSTTPDVLIQQYRELANTSAQAADEVDAARQQVAKARATPRTSASRQRITKLRASLVEAQTIAAEADLRARGVEAQYLSSGDISDAADLVLVVDGVITGDDRSSRLQRYSLLGLIVGLVAAIVAATTLDRRRPMGARVQPRMAGAGTDGGPTSESATVT